MAALPPIPATGLEWGSEAAFDPKRTYHLAMNVSSKLHTAARRFAAELTAIVAGVLIALAIDEWRQNLQNESIERDYYTQLVSDLQATDEAVLAVEEYNSGSIDAVSRLLKVFEDQSEADAAQVVDLLVQSIKFDNPVPVLGTVDALIATGDLRLVRDPGIRSRLTEYQSVVRDYWLSPLYQWENRHYDLISRIYTFAISYGIFVNSRNVAADESVGADLDAFLADRKAYAALVELQFIKTAMASYRSEIQNAAATLAREIQGYEDADQ